MSYKKGSEGINSTRIILSPRGSPFRLEASSEYDSNKQTKEPAPIRLDTKYKGTSNLSGKARRGPWDDKIKTASDLIARMRREKYEHLVSPYANR